MKWELVYTQKADKDLMKIERSVAQRIVLKLESYLKTGNPLRTAKKLKAPFTGLYRFRIGEYRVIFEINKEKELTVLFILRVRHRKDSYK